MRTRNGPLKAAVGAAWLAASLAAFAPLPAGALPADWDSAPAAVRCERGFVHSARRQGCVRIHSGIADDGELYAQGRALALAGSHDSALDVLEAITQKHTMAFTMIGYAHRKLGDFAAAIVAYQAALALDPDNADAREYLGEAYVEIGRPDLAQVELTRIEAICGNRTCEPYRDLAGAIAGEEEK